MSVRVFVGRWVDAVVSEENEYNGYIAWFKLEGRRKGLEYMCRDLCKSNGKVIYENVVVFFHTLDVDAKIKLRRTLEDGLMSLDRMAQQLSNQHAQTIVRRAFRDLREFKPDRVYDFTIAVNQIWAFAEALVDGDHAIAARVFKFL